MKAIAAMARNRVIGKEGRIPWHLPEDFRWFKQATLGGVVVMGRKTFESLGRPLPGRENVVLSRGGQAFTGAHVVRSLDALWEQYGGHPHAWLIGGAELYEALLPRCTDLFLSLVDLEVEGDAYFPAFEAHFTSVGTVQRWPTFRVEHYRRNGAEEAVAPVGLGS